MAKPRWHLRSARIVRHGLPGRQEPWPATATQFSLFQMSDTWFLVPDTPAADDDSKSLVLANRRSASFKKLNPARGVGLYPSWRRTYRNCFVRLTVHVHWSRTAASCQTDVTTARNARFRYASPRSCELTGEAGLSEALFARQLQAVFAGVPVCELRKNLSRVLGIGEATRPISGTYLPAQP